MTPAPPRRALRWAVAAVALAAVAGCGPAQEGGGEARALAPAGAPASRAVPAHPAASDSASAAFASFRIRNWTLEDGLLGRARDIAQTSDGYLWVTTDVGLFRFDGARFVAFTEATVPAFRSDNLQSVDVLPSGDLWVGSQDGWTYRLRDGEWSAFDIAHVFGPGWVQGVTAAADGSVWAASTGVSVARFDGGAWVPIDQRIRDVWTPFVADAEGTLWTYLDAADAPSLPPSPLHSRRGVVARWDGERFVPAQDDRLLGFERTQHGPLFHRLEGEGGVPAALASVRGRRVVLEDADGTPRGEYVVGAEPSSAKLVDRAGRVWTEPLASDGTLTVLAGAVEVARIHPEGSTWIESVFEDRQGNVWVLSSGGGLLQATPDPFRQFGPDEGAPLKAEFAVVGADGTVLVSAAGGAEEAPFLAVRGETWTSQAVSPGAAALLDGDSGRSPTVGVVTEDGRGRRFGAYGSRLVQIDGGRAERSWTIPSGYLLFTLFPDPAAPDVLWAGDSGGTLWRVDTEALAPTDSFRVPPPATGEVWPMDVHRGPDGRLWVASRGGLVVVGADGRPRPVTALAGVPVRDLETGPGGAVWAATETRGLVRIRDGAVDAFGVDEGLPTAHVVTVLFDDAGYAWLSGRSLLHRVRVADVERRLDAPASGPVAVVTLPPAAGHRVSPNSFVTAAKAPDGALWIPSRQGVTRIDPAAYVRQFAQPPPVLIEAVSTASGASPLANGADVRLARGDRSPVVGYTATDLTAPALVRFRTRLGGHDAGWQDQGDARSAVYGGLGPGTYTFEVQARNGGGVWSEPVRAEIVVPAFFYETAWFGALGALGLLGALVLGIRARERTLTERQRRLAAVVEERTEQLRAEKETVAAQARSLATLDATKSTFFANVSHEFRTPLTLTLGPLDDILAGEYGPVPAPIAEPVGLARRSAGRVLGLINQILEVSRLEAGHTPLRARRLDLAAFVFAQAHAFCPLAEHRRIALDLAVPDAPVHAWVDPEQASTILSNLLSNAFKFTPPGGRVRVTVEADAPGDGAHARVTVRDSGPGIAAADLPHVFDRFYQAAGSAGQPLGSGIGLSLAQELAALHGGTVTVESQVGFGSAFTLRLPLGDAHLAPSQRDPSPWEAAAAPVPDLVPDDIPSLAPAPEADEDRTTVLVADDHPDIRRYLRRHLEGAGYRVVEAADGQEALAAARERLPDLVVSDVMMPRLDGLGLCRALRADPETDFVPILLLTAKAAPEDRMDGLSELCDDYLTKPFDVRELVARVDNLIAIRRRLRERFAAGPSGDGSAEPEAPPIESADDAFVALVREAIAAGLADDAFGVSELAEAVGQSRSHLLRRTTALLGAPPSDLLRTARLDRAAELLAARAGSVSEVAYAVGFKSVAHFSNAFLAHAGCRPSAYAETAE